MPTLGPWRDVCCSGNHISELERIYMFLHYRNETISIFTIGLHHSANRAFNANALATANDVCFLHRIAMKLLIVYKYRNAKKP